MEGEILADYMHLYCQQVTKVIPKPTKKIVKSAMESAKIAPGRYQYCEKAARPRACGHREGPGQGPQHPGDGAEEGGGAALLQDDGGNYQGAKCILGRPVLQVCVHVQVHIHGYAGSTGEVPAKDSTSDKCTRTRTRTRTCLGLGKQTRVHFKYREVPAKEAP